MSGFCVAILDEALELRKADIVKPILVLGVVSPEYAPLAAANDISLTAPNLEWLKEASKYLQKENLKLKIHLAIDSGMGRIGFNEDQEFVEANKLLETIIPSSLRVCLLILLRQIVQMILILSIK